MCEGHKKTRKFKTTHLCDLLCNLKTISLVRKAKKYLKRRVNFSKVASCQPVANNPNYHLLVQSQL